MITLSLAMNGFLHGARTLFAPLPHAGEVDSEFSHREAANQQRRLAYSLLTANPGIAADLFAAADLKEQVSAR